MNITDADRDAAHSYLRGQVRRTFQGDTDLAKQYLIEAFAAHRLRGYNAGLDAAANVADGYDIDWAKGTGENIVLLAKVIRAMIEGETDET